MARPFTASDDEILLAARNVITKRGPDAFSMAEVANEVGLSRAAIILRFKSTHALKVASLAKMVEQFAEILDTLPKTPSGDNVLRVAAYIGGHVRSRESSLRFFSNYYSSNVRDPELLQLERRRGDALQAAISKVMPPTSIEHDAAVLAFRSHLTGSIMAWLSLDDTDSRRYVVMRSAEWLGLAHIPFTAQLVQELSAPQIANTALARPTVARNKTTRTAKRSTRRSKSVDAG
jgi:TetR/AcrR family macrolide resistance operon transcriptional repressor